MSAPNAPREPNAGSTGTGHGTAESTDSEPRQLLLTERALAAAAEALIERQRVHDPLDIQVCAVLETPSIEFEIDICNIDVELGLAALEKVRGASPVEQTKAILAAATGADEVLVVRSVTHPEVSLVDDDFYVVRVTEAQADGSGGS